MKLHDPLDQWMSERAGEAAPDGFADRVMAALRERSVEAPSNVPRETSMVPRRSSSRRSARVVLAACAAMACHGALVGAIWLAWPQVAQ
jgi:hypothetical protein